MSSSAKVPQKAKALGCGQKANKAQFPIKKFMKKEYNALLIDVLIFHPQKRCDEELVSA